MSFFLFLFSVFIDLQLDYSLTDDFCRNHFLVGLLLREVCGALQEFGEVRQIGIQVLKTLMIKHTFDDRYVSKVSAQLQQKTHFIYIKSIRTNFLFLTA